MKTNQENKGGVPVPIPGTPVGITIDPVALVNGILDCYKDVKINEDIQATERLRIREQARVCIAAIEADTRKFELALSQVGAERMAMVTAICELISRDVLDENSVKICEFVLNYLNQNSPLSIAGSSGSKLLPYGSDRL